MVGGREVDELLGAATLQIGGDVAARLVRGERVALPVVLNPGGAQQPGATTKKNPMDWLVGAVCMAACTCIWTPPCTCCVHGR